MALSTSTINNHGLFAIINNSNEVVGCAIKDKVSNFEENGKKYILMTFENSPANVGDFWYNEKFLSLDLYKKEKMKNA